MTEPEKCPRCKGTGLITVVPRGVGRIEEVDDCPLCKVPAPAEPMTFEPGDPEYVNYGSEAQAPAEGAEPPDEMERRTR